MQQALFTFTDQEILAVADYLSRLSPPEEKLAKSPNWSNPDFPNYLHPTLHLEKSDEPTI
jgi:hypothetical protein